MDLPLDGVARTTLWTVYCRAACSAAAELHDPEATRICEALGPSRLKQAFGRPAPSFAVRARHFDRRVQAFLDAHPGAAVVSLGEGLETQRHRVRGYGTWTSVDLPPVLELRARFLPPDERHRHRAGNVTERLWLDDLGRGPAVVVAQGLFMYLRETEVRALVRGLPQRGELVLLFDVVPPWLSWVSRLRPPMSRGLRVPHMPWGVRARGLPALVEDWLGPRVSVQTWPIPMPSGPLPGHYRTSAVEVRWETMRSRGGELHSRVV